MPSITATAAADVTQTTAKLTAGIRPGFRSTGYHFEFGRTAAYGQSTGESRLPASDNSTYPVEATISSLAPLTTYHFRVVATNAIGTSDGPDQVFTTTAITPVSPPPPHTCKHGFRLKRGKCTKIHRKSTRRNVHHHRGAH